MGVARGESALRLRVARIVLYREQQFWHCFLEPSTKEMCLAYREERRADPRAWAEPHRDFDMLDPDVGLARPSPEDAAELPLPRETRIEQEGAVYQPDHGADVLAEIGQRLSGIREGARIVAGHFERTPGVIDRSPSVRGAIIASAIKHQPKAALRGPGKRRSVIRVARDRLLHQPQSLGDLS